MSEPLNLEIAARKALDYAATRCRTCASGELRCQKHSDEDEFIADVLERFGQECQQQVYENKAYDVDAALADYQEELEITLERGVGRLLGGENSALRDQVLKMIREAL